MNIVIACGKTQPQGRVGVLRRRAELVNVNETPHARVYSTATRPCERSFARAPKFGPSS